jgi:putative hydrolase of the HAD superfamily
MKTINRRTIIFDLDDTLIDTSHLFWEVKNEILTKLSSLTNIKYNVLDKLFEDFENENIIKYGHLPERYEYTTCMLCEKLNIKDKDMYISIAKKIYMSFPSKLPNAEELLRWCKKYYNLALLTRGVKNLQLQKIVKNDLDKYFSENSIKVVPSKDKDTFLNFIKELNIEKDNCIIIGDSIKSDIIPGLEAGIDVIHYNYTHEHYEWIQDKEETDLKFISVNDLLQIKEILQIK